MKNRMMAFLIVAALLAGCTKEEVGQEVQPPVEDAGGGEADQAAEPEEKVEVEEGTLTKESSIAMAETAEELADLPPGLLTADFTVDKETSMWASQEVPSEIREDFLDDMKAWKIEEKNSEDVLDRFRYLLGSSQYGPLVGRLNTFYPEFDEPLLPEPYEITENGMRQPEKPPANAIILLDASSSMLLQADGRLKMDTAKAAVRSFAKTMGQESKVSLYIYGHAGSQNRSDEQLSCSTIDEVYLLGEYDQKAFNAAVKEVQARGWTPLAGAIKQVGLDHEKTSEDLTVYIVSDGEETCGGDPVEEARKMAEGNPDRHINVIGFQVDSKAESQLKAVAEAGNGAYMAADNLEEMTTQITKLWLPTNLDLVGLMYEKADAWPKTMAIQTVSDYAEKARDAVRVEHVRFLGAVKLLSQEELIDGQTAEELNRLIDEQKEFYNEMLEEKKVEKRQLIDDEVNRINQKIDDYLERIEKLKKEQ
ncbi:VWA domain-containing protein [Sporosarcina sp. FSL W7-1349]|uniref:VWA domain-containing protein n=1 Tax=Sporosarcina sp. FSL W7-1349 TaxID=2921561 RepID=UPI0030FA3E0E